MLKLGFLGGGGHSRNYHLPAVRRYQTEFPGTVALTAFCDVNPSVASQIGGEYEFDSTFTHLDAMLAACSFDAFIAITPVDATARVAATILNAGIPLLMEKPPGATLAETDHLCELATRLDSRVMVSMNRRFDPALKAACDWCADRPFHHLRASMLRHSRTEPLFMADTAIHCVDAVRCIGGEIERYTVRSRRNEGVWWYLLDLSFVSGATGIIEISPTCGCVAESYEMTGTGYRAIARIAEFDDGTFSAWQDGQRVKDEDPSAGLPPFVRNGTYAETTAFFSAVSNGLPLHPTPMQVRHSVEICHDAVRTDRPLS